jgi:hypothetical protein
MNQAKGNRAGSLRYCAEIASRPATGDGRRASIPEPEFGRIRPADLASTASSWNGRKNSRIGPAGTASGGERARPLG